MHPNDDPHREYRPGEDLEPDKENEPTPADENLSRLSFAAGMAGLAAFVVTVVVIIALVFHFLRPE